MQKVIHCGIIFDSKQMKKNKQIGISIGGELVEQSMVLAQNTALGHSDMCVSQYDVT